MSGSEPTRPGALGLTIPPGTVLNGIFEIEKQIGAGGMGMVYRAHNIETGDAVAIKVVRAEMADNPQVIALFRREAAVLHKLLHDAIVRYYLFTSDKDIGRPYLATEFVGGTALSQIIEDGAMERAQVLALAERVADGLQAAHNVSIFHRDISPDNIILPERDVKRAKIIDFGIAKAATLGGQTVIGDSIAGKFDYMSPEQLGLYGGALDGRSDIYSLGIVLAEATLGRGLNMGGTQLEVVEKRRKVPDLSAFDPGMRRLLTSMLQPKPDDRIQTMAEVASAARTLRSGKAPGKTGGGLGLGKIAAGLVVLVVGGGVLYFVVSDDSGTRPSPGEAPAPILVRQDETADPRDAEPPELAALPPSEAPALTPSEPPALTPNVTPSAEDEAAPPALTTPEPPAEREPAAVAQPDEQGTQEEATQPPEAPADAPPADSAAVEDATTQEDTPPAPAPAAEEPATPERAASEAQEPAADATPPTAPEPESEPDSAEPTAPEVAQTEPEEPPVSQTVPRLPPPPGPPPLVTPDPPASVAEAEAQTPAEQPEEETAATDDLPPAPQEPPRATPEPEEPDSAAPEEEADRTEQIAALDDSSIDPSPPEARPRPPEPEEATAPDADTSLPITPDPEPPQEDEREVASIDPAAAISPAQTVRRFIENADLGPCTYVNAEDVGEKSAAVVAFGNSVPPFEAFDADFTDALGFEAAINLRLVADGQCAALDLADIVRQPDGGSLRFEIESDDIAPGEVLAGTISGLNGRDLLVYLIASDGRLYDLQDLVTRGEDDAVLHTVMSGSSGDNPAHVLLAIAANGLPQTGTQSPADASTELAALAKHLLTAQDSEAVLGYFKYDR